MTKAIQYHVSYMKENFQNYEIYNIDLKHISAEYFNIDVPNIGSH